jgi:hypothetical protein
MRTAVTLVASLIGALSALPAHAACPLADSLIDQYGISFSGFERAIPRVAAPAEKSARASALVQIRLPNRKGAVPDGFNHLAVINTEEKRAWIWRTGGFLHVREWYGPIPLQKIDLTGCLAEAATLHDQEK